MVKYTMIRYMPESMTGSVTESVMEIVMEIQSFKGMELPMVWGNIKCTDRVGGAGWCNGKCDGRSLSQRLSQAEGVTEV